MVRRIQAPEWLSAEEVSDILGVTVQTVHNRAAMGEFPRPETRFDIPQVSIQRKMKWSRAEVEKFLNGSWVRGLGPAWGQVDAMTLEEKEAL